MRNDIFRGRTGALRALSAREVCTFARVVAVLAVALGLLSMHTLGSGHAGHELVAAAAQEGPARAGAAHVSSGHATVHADANPADAQLLAHDQRLRDAGPDAACVPADPEERSGAHCIPAPGSAAPAPPAVVVLGRSDALPQPPAAAAARSVLARGPTPDLALLSISRT